MKTHAVTKASSDKHGEPKEMQADLRHPTLEPRTHVLGSEGAKWSGVDIGTDGYKRGDDVDLTEVFITIILLLLAHPCIERMLTTL